MKILEHHPPSGDAARDRRNLARQMRALTQLDEFLVTAERAADHFELGRNQFFVYMRELELWEKRTPIIDQAREIAFLYPDYPDYIWALTSGEMYMQYAENMLSSEIMAIMQGNRDQEDLSAQSDALLD